MKGPAAEAFDPPRQAFGLYEILLACDAGLDAVRIDHDAAARPVLDDARRRELAALLREREAEGRPLVRDAAGALPPLHRYLGFRVEPSGRIVIRAGRTDYGEYLLTNVRHPEWRWTLGPAAMSDPVGFSAVVLGSEGKVPLGVRAGGLEDAGLVGVVPSGHPHPPGTIEEALAEELLAEAGVGLAETTRRRFAGLVRTLGSRKTELCLLLDAAVPCAEIPDRPRRDAWEFREIVPLAWDPGPVAAWLRGSAARMAPPGHGALLLAGRAAFGADWFETVLEGRPAP